MEKKSRSGINKPGQQIFGLKILEYKKTIIA
jgi:hypothetical protein